MISGLREWGAFAIAFLGFFTFYYICSNVIVYFKAQIHNYSCEDHQAAAHQWKYSFILLALYYITILYTYIYFSSSYYSLLKYY